jgi:hypothetical protein
VYFTFINYRLFAGYFLLFDFFYKGRTTAFFYKTMIRRTVGKIIQFKQVTDESKNPEEKNQNGNKDYYE